MSSILKNPKCLRAFQSYSDNNNPWEFDGAVTVGKQHEFLRLGDEDDELNYEYTPEFTRPVDDPVLHPDTNRLNQLQWDRKRKLYLKSVGVDDWSSHMILNDGGYDSELDREDEEIEVGEQTQTIIDNYISSADDDETEKYAVDFDNHDSVPQIPQAEIKIEELEDSVESNGDVILKVSVDDEARRVAIEALAVSDHESLCRLDDTFYVDIAKMQKEVEFESVENGHSWAGYLKMCSSRHERLWSKIARCEPVAEFMQSHGLARDMRA